jgi:DNA-binding CsgD family transcriptional regulator
VVSAGFGIAILLDLLYTWGGWVFDAAAFITFRDLLFVWTIPHLITNAITFAALALMGARVIGHLKLCLPFAVVLICVGHGLLLYSGSSTSLSFLITFAALFIGGGISLLLLIWVQLFDDFTQDESQVIILGSLVIYAVLFQLISLLPSGVVAFIPPFLVLLTLAAAYGAIGIVTPLRSEHLSRSGTGGFPGIRTLALLRNPLLCAMAIMFTVPLIRIMGLFDGVGISLMNSVSVVVIVLAACTLFLVRYGPGRDHKAFRNFDIPKFYRIALPLIATVLVLYTVFGSPLALTASVLTFILFYLIWMLMIPTCVKIAHELNVSPLVTYGIASSVVNLVFAGSAWLSTVLYLEAPFADATVSVCIIFVLYVLMMATAAQNGHKRKRHISKRTNMVGRPRVVLTATRGRSFLPGTEDAKDEQYPVDEEGVGSALGNGGLSLMTLEEACYDLGQTHLLTPRECDILVLLANGRDTPYIANQLFISKNTVRTHVKNLYVKIGVHSKQDLLDLLHAEGTRE